MRGAIREKNPVPNPVPSFINYHILLPVSVCKTRFPQIQITFSKTPGSFSLSLMPIPNLSKYLVTLPMGVTEHSYGTIKDIFNLIFIRFPSKRHNFILLQTINKTT